MLLLIFIDFLVTALVILVVITQVLFPAISGTPLFPFFRRRRVLEQKLAEAKEKVVEAELEQSVAREIKRAAALHRSPAVNSVDSGESK